MTGNNKKSIKSQRNCRKKHIFTIEIVQSAIRTQKARLHICTLKTS